MELVPVLPKRPLWTDRQLIAAADLKAEQGWQDAQLARLRRYALGWGVVAGLEVIYTEDGALQIGPGYAVSPLGHEVYLAEALTWEEIKAALLAACLPEYCGSCDDPRGLPDAVTEVSYEAWIVVRPDLVQSCPRPLIAEGCGNAGNAWALSRQSGALKFEVVCALEAGLLPDARPCPEVQALFAGGVVPMPPDLPDMVPLAHIGFTVFGIESITMATRRRLLPLSEVQAALTCCDCQTPVPVTPTPVEPTPVEPPASVWKDPLSHRFTELFAESAGFFPDPVRDPSRSVASVFATRGTPPLGRFIKDPLEAFVAAAVVVTEADLALWQAGDFAKIVTTAAKGPVFGPRGGTGLRSMTLAQVMTKSPNVAAFLTAHGDEQVKALDDLVAAGPRDDSPGVRAILLFVQLRLDQMLKG